MWWHWRLGNACDIRAWHLCVEIAVEPIALHSDVFRLLRAKGPVMCLPLLSNVLHTIFCHTMFHTPLCHTPSFTYNFVTRSLSHTTFTHTIFHTQLCHTYHFSLSHTLSFTYHFVTHNSSHTTCCFTSRSSITSFVFPSFPLPPTTFVDHYWKKLTCRVIRSFNFCSPSRTHPGLMGGLVAFPRTLKAQYELGCALVAHWSAPFGGLWEQRAFGDPLASRSYEVRVRSQTSPRESRGGICLDRTYPWRDQGWIGQRPGCADQAARLQLPKAKTCRVQVHWTSLLADELRSGRERKRQKHLPISVVAG